MVCRFPKQVSHSTVEPLEPHGAARRGARGFSFTELLFAVLILGIGFIMIAAIFPVGLSQTKSNFDETHAASIARGAVEALAQMATDADFPSTGGIMVPVQTTPTANRTLIAQSNMIAPSDPRYAWVALYSRDAGSNAAHVVVIVANRSNPFDGRRASTGDPYVANETFKQTLSTRILEPRQVRMKFVGDAIQIISIVSTPGANRFNAGAAGPSGYIVLAPTATQITAADLTVSGGADAEDCAQAARHLDGHVYRLGEDRTGGFFGIFPGSEFVKETFIYKRAADGTMRTVTINNITTNVNAFIVGRNRIGTASANDFEGPVMDVAYYTSFITVK